MTVADARFAKPIDAGLMAQLAAEHDLLVTVEEGVLAGGFGSAVWETLNETGAGAPRILRVGLPDRYVTHGKPALLHEEVGFTGERIAERVAPRSRRDPPASTPDGASTLGSAGRTCGPGSAHARSPRAPQRARRPDAPAGRLTGRGPSTGPRPRRVKGNGPPGRAGRFGEEGFRRDDAAAL